MAAHRHRRSSVFGSRRTNDGRRILVYELNCGLWEEDRFSEDDPILSPRPIARYPGGDREFFFRLDILTTEDLDQELGKDEIYGLLLLRPTEGPGTPLTFKTNLIKRRFRD